MAEEEVEVVELPTNELHSEPSVPPIDLTNATDEANATSQSSSTSNKPTDAPVRVKLEPGTASATSSSTAAVAPRPKKRRRSTGGVRDVAASGNAAVGSPFASPGASLSLAQRVSVRIAGQTRLRDQQHLTNQLRELQERAEASERRVVNLLDKVGKLDAARSEAEATSDKLKQQLSVSKRAAKGARGSGAGAAAVAPDAKTRKAPKAAAGLAAANAKAEKAAKENRALKVGMSALRRKLQQATEAKRQAEASIRLPGQLYTCETCHVK